MDRLMRLLAPRSAIGFVSRLAFFVAIVALANLAFAFFFDHGHEMHAPIYYVSHATVVGGPMIAFFLAVSVFQIKLQRKLWRLSRKDGLTGLNNRRTFLDLTTQAREAGSPGVLFMLDADWFKNINDTFGHRAGDQCLRSIAYTLRRNLRHADIVGRIGGEEFAVYLRDSSLEEARVIGERLTKPIPFQFQDEEHLTVTLSIGAVKSSPDDTLDDMLGLADEALYRAKLNGRAQMVFWDGKLEVRTAVGQ